MKYPKMMWGKMEAVLNIIGGEEGVEKLIRGELVIVKAAISMLLEEVGLVSIQAVEKFVAKDHFTMDNKEAKIGWIGDDFRNNFLGKVEEAQAKTTLRISKLKENSLDKPILAELGSKAETTLASIWELLKKQPNGKPGKLLVNGYANIFYVRDAKGVLWAVNVRWYSDDEDWDVDAYSVERQCVWYEGRQVFSSNS